MKRSALKLTENVRHVFADGCVRETSKTEHDAKKWLNPNVLLVLQEGNDRE